MNRSGSANRPQSDHITTTKHPAIYRAEYGCLQGGSGRREDGGRSKEKRREEEIAGWKGRKADEMTGAKADKGKVKKEWDKRDRKGERARGSKLARGMKCF